MNVVNVRSGWVIQREEVWGWEDYMYPSNTVEAATEALQYLRRVDGVGPHAREFRLVRVTTEVFDA